MSRAIVPKGAMLSPSGLKKALTNTAEGIARAIKIDYQVTTQTWKKRPPFGIERKGLNREVFTDDEIYGYVDEGTKPHEIKPKRAKVLAFGGGAYRPKTKVRVIGSTGGGPSGDTVFSKGVHHPGTEAREFTEVIADKWDKRVDEVFQAAIVAVVK